MEKEKEKCPVCKGKGEIEKPAHGLKTRQRRKKYIAQTLKDEGFTMREIAALMGYKSPSTVDYILKK